MEFLSSQVFKKSLENILGTILCIFGNNAASPTLRQSQCLRSIQPHPAVLHLLRLLETSMENTTRSWKPVMAVEIKPRAFTDQFSKPAAEIESPAC